MKKWMSPLLGVLLLAGCSIGSEATVPADEAEGAFQETEKAVVAEAVIEPAHWSMLGFKTSGEVVEVLVEEGDTVAAGDVLVRLDPTDAQLTVKQAEADLETAQARLALTKASARAEEIAAAEAQIEAAQAAVMQATAQLDQLKAGATGAEIAGAEAQVASAMAEQKIAEDAHDDTMDHHLGRPEEEARYELHAAEQALAAAQAQLADLLDGTEANQIRAANAAVSSATAQQDAVQAQLDLLQAGATPEEIAVAEAEVARAEPERESAQVSLTHTEVRAPFAGTITNINVEVGNMVGPGYVACVLATLDQLQARTTNLKELDVARIAVGQKATVTLDALTGQEFDGVVRQIALQGKGFRGEVVYDVTVELMDVADSLVHWGMSASVEFEMP
jgi:membrane fusion protein (multidrug efflux system)